MNFRYLFLLSLVSITTFNYGAQAKQSSLAPKVGYHSKKGGQDKLLKFYTPIKATPDGITNFLRYIYNDPEYAQDYLPNDFSHLYQLLNKKQTRTYGQLVMRLFSNKLKSSPYVNAHAFSFLLEQLPNLLEPYFVTQRPTGEFDKFHKKINSILYARFLDKFDDFKTNPSIFFDDLSHEIVDALVIAPQDMSSEISAEELRKTTLVFLEVGLGKLIWSPQDGMDSWKSVKKISEQLMRLSDANVLTDTGDINDLFITLLERYCYFIDIATHDLPLEFYTAVQKDITTAPLAMLTHEEQESMIEPKMDRFKRALTIGEARVRAHKKGIVT